MNRFLRIASILGALALAGFSLALLAVFAAYTYVAPSLPSVETLRDIQLQVPMRIYSRDGRLMAEFGEKRRIPVASDDIPLLVSQAFLAAEDDRFYEHPGVDYQGIIRAAYAVLSTGELTQGGSTITMQLARNYFLTREKKWIRKLREVFLALRVEREFDKPEILTLYLNKIFLGQRAYGVAAAAEVYYGKSLDQLTIGEAAMIAGLPAAPSAYNPISNPRAAENRRAYVLRRMNELGFIDDTQHTEALTEPVETYFHGPIVEVAAPYVAEMTREWALNEFGAEAAYTNGYRVTTTIDSRLQTYAISALRETLHDYDERHGYRGPIDRLGWPLETEPDGYRRLLDQYARAGGLQLGLVIGAERTEAKVFLRDGVEVTVPWESLEWGRAYVDDTTTGPAPEKALDVVQPGDVVYLRRLDDQWRLATDPEVQGAFVGLDPLDGAIVALAGGYDYYRSKFNRAVQARRQPGSAFKPFIYSAALANGFTLARVVIDAPVVIQDAGLEDTWRPGNYGGTFSGPTRLREALVYSKNLVSIRVLRDVGVRNAIDHMEKFGFSEDELPYNLSLALGSASLSPLHLAAGYTRFANGGYQIEPYFIQRVEGPNHIESQVAPYFVCAACAQPEAIDDEANPIVASVQPMVAPDTGELVSKVTNLAPRTIEERNIYLMVDMMRDVIRRGTGRRALALGRNDLAGKTGTTNEEHDAWFSGYNGTLVGTAWVGFDQARSLGRSQTGGREQGAVTALPMWVRFMGNALEGVPETVYEQPEGLMTVRISARTGRLAGVEELDVVEEIFREENVPDSDVGEERDPYEKVIDDIF